MEEQNSTNLSILFSMSNETIIVERANCKFFHFVLWGVIGSTFCLLGMIGNTLAFTAFQKDRRTPATTLLQCLACSDFVLLCAVFVTDDIPYACDYSTTCDNLWSIWPYIRYVWLLTPMSHMCSIWFVVLIAMNRYWAVCKPHMMNRFWSLQRTTYYVGAVLVMVFVFNAPRFFEYKIVTKTKNFSNETYVEEMRTNFGLHTAYKVVYKAYLVNVLLVLLPLLMLIMLTFPILRAMHIKKKKSEAAGKKTSLSKASQDITFVLSIVLVVAIGCQTPLACFHFVRYSYRYHCGDFVFYLDNVSKMLINTNSCFNFIIYCLFSARFRRLLLATLMCQGNGYMAQVDPVGNNTRREYSMSHLRG